MSVLDKATNRLADVLATEHGLMTDLNRVRTHKAKLIEFIDMYRRFDAPEEPRSEPPVSEQAVPAEEPAVPAEVTPADAESVTAEEGEETSSAQSLANAGDEATAREEAQPAPMAEVEPASRLAAGRTADAGEAGSGLGASPAPIPLETVDTGAADEAPADAQSSEVATREDAASAAPETLTWKARVAETHAAHPAWTAAMIAAELGITAKHVRDAAGDAGVTLAAARRGPTSDLPPLKDRVLAVLAEHPDWTARQIADHLGVAQSDVSQLSYAPHHLPIRKLTAEELTEARKSGGRTGGLAKAGKAEEPPPAPTPPPEPERPPAPSVPAPRAVNDDEIIPPEPNRIKRPKGTQFRLRDRETGLYLHQDLAQSVDELRLTPLRAYPWQGTADQLLAVRKKYPATRDLSEVVVEKEPARV